MKLPAYGVIPTVWSFLWYQDRYQSIYQDSNLVPAQHWSWNWWISCKSWVMEKLLDSNSVDDHFWHRMFFASAETNLQFEKLEIEQCEEYIYLVLKFHHSRFLKSHRGCFLLAERIYNRVCKMRSSSNAAGPIDPDPPAPNSDVKFLSLIKYHWTDWVCLVILIIIEIILEVIHPYKRYVGPKNFVTGELLYPMHSQTIPFYAVPVSFKVFPFSLQVFMSQRQLWYVSRIIIWVRTG